jgi:hypothetical protein
MIINIDIKEEGYLYFMRRIATAWEEGNSPLLNGMLSVLEEFNSMTYHAWHVKHGTEIS